MKRIRSKENKHARREATADISISGTAIGDPDDDSDYEESPRCCPDACCEVAADEDEDTEDENGDEDAEEDASVLSLCESQIPDGCAPAAFQQQEARSSRAERVEAE